MAQPAPMSHHGNPPAPRLWSRFQASLRHLGPAAPLFAVAVVGPLLGVTLLVASTGTWLPWFDDSLPSLLAYVGLGVLCTAGCLLPTHATSFVAGWLFGAWLGPAVAWLIVLLAGTLGFWALQRLVGARVVEALAQSPRGRAVHHALLGRGAVRATWLIALLQLSPVLPFAATNLLLAALQVRGPVFVLATVVGITPRAIAVAWAGAGLQELDWNAGQLQSPWWTAFTIATTLLVLVVIGRAARAALRRELATV